MSKRRHRRTILLIALAAMVITSVLVIVSMSRLTPATESASPEETEDFSGVVCNFRVNRDTERWTSAEGMFSFNGRFPRGAFISAHRNVQGFLGRLKTTVRFETQGKTSNYYATAAHLTPLSGSCSS
jgi:hypothetical protein